MKLPDLIKEAILQAKISLDELDDGKIYGGVLETHLYKLAKASKQELQEIRNTRNQVLMRECEEIFQEAKEALKILEKYKIAGEETTIPDEELEIIKSLLERVKMLEIIVAEQESRREKNMMSRRGFLGRGLMAAAGTFARPLMAFAQNTTDKKEQEVTLYLDVYSGKTLDGLKWDMSSGHKKTEWKFSGTFSAVKTKYVEEFRNKELPYPLRQTEDSILTLAQRVSGVPGYFENAFLAELKINSYKGGILEGNINFYDIAPINLNGFNYKVSLKFEFEGKTVEVPQGLKDKKFYELEIRNLEQFSIVMESNNPNDPKPSISIAYNIGWDWSIDDGNNSYIAKCSWISKGVEINLLSRDIKRDLAPNKIFGRVLDPSNAIELLENSIKKWKFVLEEENGRYRLISTNYPPPKVMKLYYKN